LVTHNRIAIILKPGQRRLQWGKDLVEGCAFAFPMALQRRDSQVGFALERGENRFVRASAGDIVDADSPWLPFRNQGALRIRSWTWYHLLLTSLT
jgi:hypothetical protein